MLKKFIGFDWDSKAVRILDWSLAALSLAIYLWTWDWPWLAGAVVGAAASWYRPLGKIQRFANGLVRRR